MTDREIIKGLKRNWLPASEENIARSSASASAGNRTSKCIHLRLHFEVLFPTIVKEHDSIYSLPLPMTSLQFTTTSDEHSHQSNRKSNASGRLGYG